MTEARAILLESDHYSPNSAPHLLPALHWVGLFSQYLEEKAVDELEDCLCSSGWDPQWRYKMYSQAHYHSTTHELLIVIESSADILLGGTDERAKPKNVNVSSESYTTITVKFGDALLLPAGYAHRMLQGQAGFSMIGSYPTASEKWDSESRLLAGDGRKLMGWCMDLASVRFPNLRGCQHDVDKIREMVETSDRKGLLNARSPELAVGGDTKTGETDKHWCLM